MTAIKPQCSFCPNAGYTWAVEADQRACFACLRRQRAEYRARVEALETSPPAAPVPVLPPDLATRLCAAIYELDRSTQRLLCLAAALEEKP